jgi:ABC-2 type transport system ATP-binding protein
MASNPRPREPVLEVRGLRKSYGATVAVDHVSFEVRPNEIVGLLGPNGAGKTTTINMVLGVLAPTDGTILVAGVDLARQRSRALERTNFAAVYAPLPGNLTVAQNLRVFGLMYGVPRLGERIDALVARFDLERFRDTKCGVLSSGEQTRVALAKALLNEPRLLLLDEPTASLDPDIGDRMRSHLERYQQASGCTMLLASHNMSEVERMCADVIMLRTGSVVDQGSPAQLIARYGRDTMEEVFLDIARGVDEPDRTAPEEVVT